MKKKKCYHETSLGFCPFKKEAKLKGWTPFFRVKKPVLPKIRVTNAEQGEMKITVSKKVKPGIYELVLNGNDGQQMVVTKIEVV